MEKYRASHLLVFNTPVKDPREAALFGQRCGLRMHSSGFYSGLTCSPVSFAHKAIAQCQCQGVPGRFT